MNPALMEVVRQANIGGTKVVIISPRYLIMVPGGFFKKVICLFKDHIYERWKWIEDYEECKRCGEIVIDMNRRKKTKYVRN